MKNLGLVPRGARDNVCAVENQYFGCGFLRCVSSIIFICLFTTTESLNLLS